MTETTDEQVRALRDLARRARRMATSLSNGDRMQLLAHAEEIEQQASELEQRGTDRGAAVPPPPVVQQQMQVQQQQQHETGPPVDPEKPKPKG
jgi:hypothetical protein